MSTVTKVSSTNDDFRNDNGGSLNHFWASECPHCSGTMQLCIDNIGQYRKCVNCSRTHPDDIQPMPAAEQPKNRAHGGRTRKPRSGTKKAA